MLFKKPKTYITPGGEAPALYSQLISEPHLLIAGATGSGKSVLINSLIARLLMGSSPATAKLILIDPKKVELAALAKLPHCIGYADTAETAKIELTEAVNIMMSRYGDMRKRNLKNHDGDHIYIIIDEYADLMVQAKKSIEPLITRIVQLGRAANIHLIIATQRPTREVIAGAIRVNLDCKIALHTATAQDSRNIIEAKGAEALPRFGYGYILNPDGLNPYKLPDISDKLPGLINFWTSKNCIA